MAVQFNRSYSLSSVLLSFSLLFVLFFSPSSAQCDDQLLARITRSLTIPPNCFCGGVTAIQRNIDPPVSALMLSFLVGEGPLLGTLPDPFMLCAPSAGGVFTRMLNDACCVSFGIGTVERCFPSSQVYRCEIAKVALSSSFCPPNPSKGELKAGLPIIPSISQTVPAPPIVTPLPTLVTTPQPISSSNNQTFVSPSIAPTSPPPSATTTTFVTPPPNEQIISQPSLAANSGDIEPSTPGQP